jgi:tetratricopeptide (TPR) repeat protein/tRNA A-37 threonylcarbamoyl transferase component Bud32
MESASPRDVKLDEESGTGNARAPESPTSTLRAGDLLCDRFRVIRFIARGGMGELYEAEDLELGERIAVKTIRPEIAGDDRVNQRFRREVQLARKVTHPQICRIFDLFQHVPPPGASEGPRSAVFVTMELLKGETLAARLKREGRMTVEQAFPIVAQMAAALSAAHEAGIVHRDFKSNNVMLLDEPDSYSRPRVVVTDFGLAHKLGNPEGTMTNSGELLGTPDYMAPEQIEGTAVTPATDVYALGIVMYEMVTGVRPFAADTPFASVMKRMSGPTPARPRELVRDLPWDWDATIMRCLSRRPDERFASATAVVDALGERQQPVGGRALSRRALLAVAAVLAVIPAVAIGWRAWTVSGGAPAESAAGTAANRVTPRPAIAVLGFRNLTGRSDTAWLAVALSEMLSTELAVGEQLRTISGENISRVKADLELADADSYGAETLSSIRSNLGTDFVVLGSYVILGDGEGATLRVDIRVQDSIKGEMLLVVSESGRSADLFDVIARGGSRLRERLGVRAAPEAAASVRATLSASPEAARLYAEGLIRLRRYDYLGARDLLEQSIAADGSFPLSHAALAQVWSGLGYDERELNASRRAFELSGKLPRADRLQVEGTYRVASKEWPEAIAIWQSLATFFPDDVEYVLRLANAQIASGAARAGMTTIDGFRKRFSEVNDPRLSLAEASAAETLSDFKRMQTASAAAAVAADAQRAHQLVAPARIREGAALLRMGQADKAVALFEDARRLYDAAGDRAGGARALNNLASALLDGPDTARVKALYQEGLEIARAVGEQDLVARFLNNLAIQERRAGNLETALRMNQESLSIRREVGDRTNAAISLNNIGNLLLDMGDPLAASEHYQQSAAMSREIGDRRSEARALHNAGFALVEQGEFVRARASIEDGLKLRRGIDDPASVATSLYGLGWVASLQGDLAIARQSLNESLEMEQRLDLRSAMANAISALGDLALHEGDLAGARRFHDQALTIHTELGEKGRAADSRLALAVVALEEGKSAEAETLARDAALVFVEQKVEDNEATAHATLALALAARDRGAEAAREIARARQLAKDQKSTLVRMDVALAGARVDAARDPSGAVKTLESIRAEAVRRGVPNYEFLARRAIAEIEGRRTPSAGATLAAALRQDAKARGYGLYARTP